MKLKKKLFIKSLSQYFEKEIYQYVNIILRKRTPFSKKTPPSGCFLLENTCVEVSFSSEYWEISKSTYFQENLPTAASENVFMKLRKIKIYKEF